MMKRTTQQVRQPTGNFWDANSRGILLAGLLLLPLCGEQQAEAQPMRLAPPRDMPYGTRGIPDSGYYGNSNHAAGPMPSRSAQTTQSQRGNFLAPPSGSAQGPYGPTQSGNRGSQNLLYQPSPRDYLSNNSTDQSQSRSIGGTRGAAEAVIQSRQANQPQPHNYAPPATRSGVLTPPRQVATRPAPQTPRAPSPVQTEVPGSRPAPSYQAQQGADAPPRSRWGQLPIPRSIQENDQKSSVASSLLSDPRAQWKIEQSYGRNNGVAQYANTTPPPSQAPVTVPRALPVAPEEIQQADTASNPVNQAHTIARATAVSIPAPRPQEIPAEYRGYTRTPASSAQEPQPAAMARSIALPQPQAPAAPATQNSGRSANLVARPGLDSAPATNSSGMSMLPAPRSIASSPRYEQSERIGVAQIRTRFLPEPEPEPKSQLEQNQQRLEPQAAPQQITANVSPVPPPADHTVVDKPIQPAQSASDTKTATAPEQLAASPVSNPSPSVEPSEPLIEPAEPFSSEPVISDAGSPASNPSQTQPQPAEPVSSTPEPKSTGPAPETLAAEDQPVEPQGNEQLTAADSQRQAALAAKEEAEARLADVLKEKEQLEEALAAKSAERIAAAEARAKEALQRAAEQQELLNATREEQQKVRQQLEQSLAEQRERQQQIEQETLRQSQIITRLLNQNEQERAKLAEKVRKARELAENADEQKQQAEKSLQQQQQEKEQLERELQQKEEEQKELAAQAAARQQETQKAERQLERLQDDWAQAQKMLQRAAMLDVDGPDAPLREILMASLDGETGQVRPGELLNLRRIQAENHTSEASPLTQQVRSLLASGQKPSAIANLLPPTSLRQFEQSEPEEEQLEPEQPEQAEQPQDTSAGSETTGIETIQPQVTESVETEVSETIDSTGSGNETLEIDLQEDVVTETEFISPGSPIAVEVPGEIVDVEEQDQISIDEFGAELPEEQVLTAVDEFSIDIQARESQGVASGEAGELLEDAEVDLSEDLLEDETTELLEEEMLITPEGVLTDEELLERERELRARIAAGENPLPLSDAALLRVPRKLMGDDVPESKIGPLLEELAESAEELEEGANELGHFMGLYARFQTERDFLNDEWLRVYGLEWELFDEGYYEAKRDWEKTNTEYKIRFYQLLRDMQERRLDESMHFLRLFESRAMTDVYREEMDAFAELYRHREEQMLKGFVSREDARTVGFKYDRAKLRFESYRDHVQADITPAELAVLNQIEDLKLATLEDLGDMAYNHSFDKRLRELFIERGKQTPSWTDHLDVRLYAHRREQEGRGIRDRDENIAGILVRVPIDRPDRGEHLAEFNVETNETELKAMKYRFAQRMESLARQFTNVQRIIQVLQQEYALLEELSQYNRRAAERVVSTIDATPERRLEELEMEKILARKNAYLARFEAMQLLIEIVQRARPNDDQFVFFKPGASSDEERPTYEPADQSQPLAGNNNASQGDSHAYAGPDKNVLDLDEGDSENLAGADD